MNMRETESDKAMRVVGHRGAMGLAQENTREGFRIAAALGVAAIEADVRLSKYGGVALIHDANLGRAYGLHGAVADLTMEELAAIGVPSLGELLAEYGQDFDIYIDLKEKSAGLADAVGRVVEASGAAGRAWVTGSDLKQLKRAQSGAPGIRLSWTIGSRYNTLSSAVVVEAALAGVAELAVVAHEVTRELVAQARSLGIDVRAYGIRTPAVARLLISLGCTTLTLDDPGWAEQLAAQQLLLPLVPATA